VVRTWDISTGLCKESLQTPAKGKGWKDAQMIDGRLIFVWYKDEKIHIWDTKKGELLQVVEADQTGVRDLKISGDGSKVFLLAGRFIKAWSLRTGEAVGEVELEDKSYQGLFRAGGSRICLCFPNSSTQEWDFGILGSPPIPLPSTSPERSCLGFIGGGSWWYKGLSQIKDTTTGKVVFHWLGDMQNPMRCSGMVST
jgi:WD40 repeat protein